MPGKHHASSRPSPWLVIAIVIVLAGLLAGGILLALRHGGNSGEPEAVPTPGPTAPAAQSAPEPTPVPTPTPAPPPEPPPPPGPQPPNREGGYHSGGV